MLQRILASRWTYYALAILLLLVAVWSQFEIHIPSRPVGSVEELSRLRERGDLNVIFAVIDTLRSDRLGSYGYQRPTSPVLDDLARHGVRFAQVQAQSSWTKCSMASLWTALYPFRTGITGVEHVLPPEAELPTEKLRAAGFETGGIWRNGWVASNFGFGQGFDLYLRPTPSRTPERMQLHRRNPGVRALLGTDQDITEAAIEFLSAHGHERFFLYLHYMDVHQYVFDQVAADLGFGNSFSDAYDSAIHWVDRNIGVLIRELERRDLFAKTLVVIAADHGEGFTDHGEGHARTLYREVLEVPLILALPFRLPEGIVVEPMVRNVDIWPTILDLVGLEPLSPTDGRSLVPLIEAAGQGKAPRLEGDGTSALAYLDLTWGRKRLDPDPLVSVLQDGRRLLIRPSEPGKTELYDHHDDPTEQQNVADAHPEWVEKLEAEAAAHLSQPPPWSEIPEIELDEFYREQLRALGYVIR